MELTHLPLTIAITPEIADVIENPRGYPEEMVAATLDMIINLSRVLRESKVRLEGHLISMMKSENATKLKIIAFDKAERMVTLKAGQVKADKDADNIYKNNGFDPLEIGEYVFKPSWSKAKEARKLGGPKQTIIDEIFKQDDPSIEIK
jgi:hypothetical protein